MTQRREVFHSEYRGWEIYATYFRITALGHGESIQHEGFIPRPTDKILRRGKNYHLGNPRPLDDVKAWIDEQED